MFTTIHKHNSSSIPNAPATIAMSGPCRTASIGCRLPAIVIKEPLND